MVSAIARALGKLDWILIGSIALLACLGLVAVYSVALGSTNPGDLLNFKKQAAYMIVGIPLMCFIAARLDYRALARYSTFAFIIAVVVLVAVLLWGSTIRGTTGWFSFAGISFQPVELAKICAVLFLSKFFSDKARYIGDLRYLAASSIGLIVLVGLVLAQPDFGSAMILLTLWCGYIILSGIRWTHLLALFGIVVVSGLVLWFSIFHDYQRDRIRVFLDPSLDPLGRGYNVTQATIAIGSGGLFGKGVGFGSQSQLKFLPESQTDFIFAVIAEEMGFIGVTLVIALYCILSWRLIRIAARAPDNFGSYIAIGVLCIVLAHVGINIGMNVGLVPVTGLTLPFISYGGSALLANFVLLGLVASVGSRT